MRNATLLFLVKKINNEVGEVCLAMKKRGFGAGRWNGVGGKVDANESIEDATKRETREEIDVDVKDIKKVAELAFTFPHNEAWNQVVHIYFSEAWDGEPTESEEMAPKWYKVSELPFDSMWPDDKFWLPKALEGKLIQGAFTFGEGDIILDQKLDFVESLN